VSGEFDYNTTQADLRGMHLPENGHFTATLGNATEDNTKIHLRKLSCKEEMLAKEVEDKYNVYGSVYCKYIPIYIYIYICVCVYYIYVYIYMYIYTYIYMYIYPT
jgi:hypothetical protein